VLPFTDLDGEAGRTGEKVSVFFFLFGFLVLFWEGRGSGVAFTLKSENSMTGSSEAPLIGSVTISDQSPVVENKVLEESSFIMLSFSNAPELWLVLGV